MTFCLCLGSSALGDDPLSEQHFQAICEDVGRDALLGLEHLTEVPFTAKDHVAEDQEGPTIAEDFEREVDWAKGSRFLVIKIRNQLHCCISMAKIVTDCIMQSVFEQHRTGEFDE